MVLMIDSSTDCSHCHHTMWLEWWETLGCWRSQGRHLIQTGGRCSRAAGQRRLPASLPCERTSRHLWLFLLLPPSWPLAGLHSPASSLAPLCQAFPAALLQKDPRGQNEVQSLLPFKLSFKCSILNLKSRWIGCFKWSSFVNGHEWTSYLPPTEDVS